MDRPHNNAVHRSGRSFPAFFCFVAGACGEPDPLLSFNTSEVNMNNLHKLPAPLHCRNTHLPDPPAPRSRPFRSSMRLAAAALFFLLGTGLAHGQILQNIYGPTNTIEAGKKGVRPTSLNCAGVSDGYIMVGTGSANNNDIYVVRTDNAGMTTPGWERSYDVQLGSDDHGESIVELSNGSGFVVTGYTDAQGSIDILAMKIACDGTPLWKKIYGTADAEYGYDIIEAANGDVVIAGRQDQGNNADPILLRLNSASGNLVWFRSYPQGGANEEALFSLAKVAPASGAVDDIIAVGRYGNYGGTAFRGYVLRVTGNTGVVQGAATYSGGFHDEFNAVIELQNPGQTGTNGRPNVVIAGLSTSYNAPITGNIDMYLVKLNGGDPCAPLLQKIIGYPSTNDVDVATCVREVTFQPAGGTGLQQWDLVIGGYAHHSAALSDLAVLAVDAVGFNPTLPPRVFGHPYGEEEAWSVWPVQGAAGRTEGFVLCGRTTTPWYTPVIDNGDIYLIKTDNQNIGPDCSHPYTPQHIDVNWGMGCFTPDDPTLSGGTNFNPDYPLLDEDQRVCTDATNDGYNKRIILEEENGSGLVRTQPNPVTRGQSLLLIPDGFDPEKTLQVRVVNGLGETVADEAEAFFPASGEIRMSTQGWPAGAYIITIRNGDRERTARVIVLEN